ncbi:SAM-dependent methyltransferase [Streptomyces lunaelactis]|uniref:SAM-dependent methyltransferase n=1 Tax=Streptomyces lunaelactis TaxID=1535768 RepID=UPI001585A9EA|nr:SAM-dependent methyltransferase [Streptomyces lunaelactis]NUL23393.1 SAM-dependent methyltransferase [Streptomyces lunaelactis]
MTPTLVQHRTHAMSAAAPTSASSAEACARARDWAEIQERMLVPLYEAVYERLEVGSGTRLLGLGCGSGLALLIAASRGARVTGADSDRERLALARERMGSAATAAPATAAAAAPGGGSGGGGPGVAELLDADALAAADVDPTRPAYNLITAFQPIGCVAGDSEGLGPALEAAVARSDHGGAVVLTGWGPPERCATSGVLRLAGRLTERLRSAGGWRPALRDDLEDVAAQAGLKPDGSGRVACPFGYAGVESAVRGLLSTGLYAAAVRATDQSQVEKEITEALHPYRRRDGTVWMPNVFRYLIARTR